MFRRDLPAAAEVESFHRDGYIAYPDIMLDEAREALIEEVLSPPEVRAYLARPDRPDPGIHFVRPGDGRGPLSDRLIDAPLVRNLLEATVGPSYHLCHSSMNLSRRGAGEGGIHQDHHHWRHENPVNLAERDTYYIQILYYPNGFRRGDRSLRVIPGSHKVAPTEGVTPEGLLAGDYDGEAGRKLELVDLEMPPGSMVYINARMFHGIAPKPADSEQAYRIFLIDIFKEAGPPHRYTQEIPPAWLEGADAHRRMLFERAAYSEGCWAE